MSDKLLGIFRRQKELMKKYHGIEKANGLLLTNKVPVEINDKMGQARLKSFAWNITEELTECIDSLILGSYAEYNEEMADVLHFLVEFTILAGINPATLVRDKYLPDEGDMLLSLFGENHFRFVPMSERKFADIFRQSMEVIYELGKVCNLLKNRSWKQTSKETDVISFTEGITRIWRNYIGLCRMSGIDGYLLYDLYMGKAKTNQERQETGY